ncbi:Gfo/Idh/MocA family protein [Nitratireductor alexandrii]|uniref:Gfo/Idh/MocA family protein n=1 Tax=Nitratireductor alexandrii TaxID=2448161 RepID=UPI000FDB1BAE|nr:Gfo/Idh/MocA family oxidoreductase [Nitratireductor alexandrii]
MTTNVTRVALAGFGAWGQMHAKALSAIADAEIVALYCHGENSARAAADKLPDVPRYTDYDAMLSAGGFDVVDITVPNHVHSRFATAALDAGANVFLEKPLGLTLDQCDEIIAASARSGGLVAVNHELRVSRQWGAMRDIVASGDLGKVRYQHLSLFRHKFRQGSGGWRYDPEKVGSWVLEELVHFFDLVMWYAAENGKPARVRAIGNGGESGLVRNFATTLEWEDGSMALLSQCLSGFEHHTLLEVAGEAGAARTWWSGAMDRTEHPDFLLKVQRRGGEPEEVAIPQSGEVFELEENLRRAFAGFREGRSVFSPVEARLAVEICLAAEAAFRSGGTVEIPASSAQ